MVYLLTDRNHQGSATPLALESYEIHIQNYNKAIIFLCFASRSQEAALSKGDGISVDNSVGGVNTNLLAVILAGTGACFPQLGALVSKSRSDVGGDPSDPFNNHTECYVHFCRRTFHLMTQSAVKHQSKGMHKSP